MLCKLYNVDLKIKKSDQTVLIELHLVVQRRNARVNQNLRACAVGPQRIVNMAASSVRCVSRSLSAGLPGLRSTCALLKSSRRGDISALTVCWTRSYVTTGSLSWWRHGRGVTLKGASGELLTS